MFRNLFLLPKIFVILTIVGIGYILAFFYPILLNGVHGASILFLAMVAVDIFLLFRATEGIEATRILPDKLSNGDENTISFHLKNNYPFTSHLEIIDELPIQFQIRDFQLFKKIQPKKSLSFSYPLYPKERGIYTFGKLNIYAQSPLGLVSKRYQFSNQQNLSCYPSFIHLKKYEMISLKSNQLMGNLKKQRKIGHSSEFEQIREYVTGDNIKNINWKATGKQNKLMVNQYQEEKSQRIYLFIDKGRSMKMPFDGLSLLDYSINAAMALSHIILKKQDRAGMVSFSKKVENMVVADHKNGQLKRIAEGLFNIKTNFSESDFNRLYIETQHKITQRSFILLFTNFETLDALKRQLPYLRGIAKKHLLLIVFFKNSLLQELKNPKENTHTALEVYDEIIAEKFDFEKKLIQQELLKYGIYSLYTLPHELNLELIHQYLEIKSRGSL